MLRRAMYASLVESKKPSPSKPPQHDSTTNSERDSDNASHDNVSVKSNVGEINSKSPSTSVNNNIADQSEEIMDVQLMETHIPSLGNVAVTQKKTKVSKEPSKLQNYVIKKKKEKKIKARTLLRTPSPSKPQTQSDVNVGGVTGFSTIEQGAMGAKQSSPTSLLRNGKPKKRKRQRGALAVFVAMNKSAGGKLNNHSLGKELLLKTKKKRRRKRKNFETQVCRTDGAAAVSLDCNSQRSGVESEESPVKKSKREEKKK